jgi:protein-tyrosine-phosphatase
MSGESRYMILFVCTGNTCRSPMAEGALRMLLEKERPGRAEVVSAGIAGASGYPATEYAIEAAKIWDVDISGHRSQPLTPILIDRADLVFAMAPEHMHTVLKMRPQAKGKVFLLKNFPLSTSHGEGVEDPIGQSLDRYNETFLEIGELLGKHLPEIVQRIDEKTNAA